MCPILSLTISEIPQLFLEFLKFSSFQTSINFQISQNPGVTQCYYYYYYYKCIDLSDTVTQALQGHCTHNK